MKKQLQRLSMIVLALSITVLAFSQNPSTMMIKSNLTNIDGEAVIGAKINTALLLLDSEGKTCYEAEQSLLTKDDGSFSMSIQDLPPLFTKGIGSDPAVIQLCISSPGKDAWLEEDKFVVKYLLTMTGSENYTEYTLTRMEGQKLNYEYASDIWRFTDTYPFAYIHSCFLMSFNNEITDSESLMLAAEALFKSSMDKEAKVKKDSSAPASRGLKGGAAVGGYKKN